METRLRLRVPCASLLQRRLKTGYLPGCPCFALPVSGDFLGQGILRRQPRFGRQLEFLLQPLHFP